MGDRVRLTPIGGVLLVLFALALLALFLGSRTVQAVGFVVALVIFLLLVVDGLPRLRYLARLPGMPGPAARGPAPEERMPFPDGEGEPGRRRRP